MIDSYRTTSEEYIKGRLLYIEDDLSYDYLPADPSFIKPEDCLTLVVAGTLQLLVKISTGRILYVFGYLPRAKLKKENLLLSDIHTGAVYAIEPFAMDEKGMAYDTSLSNIEPIYDPRTGWLCVGDKDVKGIIFIADGVGIGIEHGHLHSIWLKET